jgi:hypothetical protein
MLDKSLLTWARARFRVSHKQINRTRRQEAVFKGSIGVSGTLTVLNGRGIRRIKKNSVELAPWVTPSTNEPNWYAYNELLYEQDYVDENTPMGN